jgi:hypothetical protein
MGMGYDGVFLSFHEDYSSFALLRKWLAQFGFLEVAEVQSFLVNLEDDIHYRSLTFSTLAKHILTHVNQEKGEPALKRARKT